MDHAFGKRTLKTEKNYWNLKFYKKGKLLSKDNNADLRKIGFKMRQ